MIKIQNRHIVALVVGVIAGIATNWAVTTAGLLPAERSYFAGSIVAGLTVALILALMRGKQ